MRSQISFPEKRPNFVMALFLALSLCGTAQAATAPNLGTTSVNGVVSSTFTNSNIAPQSIINGDVCFTTGPVTPPLLTTGTTATPCPPAKGADQGLALANLNGQACISLGAGAITLDSVVIGANPPGTIPPGCYSSGGAMNVTATTTVTLSGPGVYVFRPGGALTTGANSRVILAGGACANDVFWAPGAAATLGANAALSATPTFVGNILDDAGISIGQFANLEGRALAFGGTVTTNAVTITVPTCAPFVVPVNPTLAKAFNAGTINVNGTSTLTVTLGNANAAVATLTSALVDTLPGNVVVANTPNASTTCGGAGAVVAVAAASSVTLPAGRTIPANGSCTLTVDVTSALVGSYVNTLPVGALVTSNGNNPAPAVATLTVIAPGVLPTLAKAFNPATINVNGTSTLTVTLGNTNAAVATLTSALVDTLPGNVVVANTPNASTTCGGAGAVVAVAAASSVTLPAGRTIPANGSCSLTVDVTSALVGSYVNTLPVGALVTSNGNNPAPAVATLTVIAPGVLPTLAKAFNPATINVNGTSTLTVTLGNTNAAVATLTAALVDTLPGNVVVANTPNASTTCGGAGAVVAVAAASSVTLPAGRTIPANGSCTLTVDVTSALVGSYVNTLPVGALVTSNGNNPAPAVATLTVIAPVVLPSLAKAFNPVTINVNGTSTLTVTLINSNATVATLTASLVDTLPVGVVIAAAPNVSTTCGGAGAPIAIAGGGNVTLPAGRSIPANGNCTLSVDVTSAVAGSYLNTLPVGALVTSNGNNPAPATATLTVIAVVFTGNPTPAPTLSEWAMIMLAGLLAAAGFAAIRKQENL